MERQKVFVDADEVAERYKISVRHWRRMCASGLAPQPVKLNTLIRWKLEVLEQWENDGCPKVGLPKKEEELNA